MWTAVRKILPFNLARLGLGSALEFNEIVANWDKLIGKNFGPKYQSKTRPISLKNKILIIDCLNSNWACDLQLKETMLVGGINKFFGKSLIEKVKFIS